MAVYTLQFTFFRVVLPHGIITGTQKGSLLLSEAPLLLHYYTITEFGELCYTILLWYSGFADQAEETRCNVLAEKNKFPSFGGMSLERIAAEKNQCSTPFNRLSEEPLEIFCL